MRSLSNPEFVQFFTDNPDVGTNLGAGQSVIEPWSGMAVLVYKDANGELWTSDVSDAPQLANISLPGYGTTAPQSMLEALPAAVVETVKDDAAAVGALANQAGDVLSAAAAAASSGLQSIESGILSPLLIGAVIVLGLLYLPRRS